MRSQSIYRSYQGYLKMDFGQYVYFGLFLDYPSQCPKITLSRRIHPIQALCFWENDGLSPKKKYWSVTQHKQKQIYQCLMTRGRITQEAGMFQQLFKVQTKKPFIRRAFAISSYKLIISNMDKDKCVKQSIDVRPARAGILVEVLLGSAVLVVAHALAGVLAVVLWSEAEWRKGSDFVSSACTGSSSIIFIVSLITSGNSTNSSSCISHCGCGSTCNIKVGQGVNRWASAATEWVVLPHLRRFAEASRQSRLGVDALALADLLVPESCGLTFEAVGLILLDDEGEGWGFILRKNNYPEDMASTRQLDLESKDLLRV